MGWRTSTSTSAPSSRSSAADSIALCPPPITATVFPRNTPRSVCSLECDASSRANPSNSRGRAANELIPVATTTRRVLNVSLSASVTWNPSPFGSTHVTCRRSTSGTAYQCYHFPYTTKWPRGSGFACEYLLSQQNETMVNSTDGSAMCDAT